MKRFSITFYFEADDCWTKSDVKEMVERFIDPICYLGDVDTSEPIVELIGED